VWLRRLFRFALAGGAFACFKRFLQRGFHTPDADLVKIQAVAAAGLQGFDEKMLLRDGLKKLFLGHWVAPLLVFTP